MAYYKQKLALVLVCLSLLHHNGIEGMKIVEIEGKQTETKEGIPTEAGHMGIFSTLFSDVITDQQSDYRIHHAGYKYPSFGYHNKKEALFARIKSTRARISVWGIPNVNYNSESAVFIAVLNENTSYSMVAGFHVYPSLYSGSTDLRLFAAWTTKNNGMVCYSTACQGFVLSNVSGAPVPGQKVAPLSTYDGKDYFLTLSIKKDLKTEDWSLYHDDNSNPILIGWWPKALFNNTFDYTTKIVWAAGVLYPKNETSPTMGSGHAATEGANKAAYISHIKVYDHSGYPTKPASDPSDFKVEGLTDRYDCFSTDGFQLPQARHNNFYYGGPPGCKN